MWDPFEYGPPVLSAFDISLPSASRGSGARDDVRLVTVGPSTVSVQRIGPGEIVFHADDPVDRASSAAIHLSGQQHSRFTVRADPAYHLIEVRSGQALLLQGILSTHGAIVVYHPGSTSSGLDVTRVSPEMDTALCRSLLGG